MPAIASHFCALWLIYIYSVTGDCDRICLRHHRNVLLDSILPPNPQGYHRTSPVLENLVRQIGDFLVILAIGMT